MKSQVYEQDFLRWTEEQTALFRSGRLSELDYDNIFGELEDMGKEQKVALQSLLRNIIIRLLKLNLSPSAEPKPAWVEEITEFRDQAQTRIDENPSLNHYAEGILTKAWLQARRAAEKSFDANRENVDIPDENPYSLEQVLDFDFLPA